MEPVGMMSTVAEAHIDSPLIAHISIYFRNHSTLAIFECSFEAKLICSFFLCYILTDRFFIYFFSFSITIHNTFNFIFTLFASSDFTGTKKGTRGWPRRTTQFDVLLMHIKLQFCMPYYRLLSHIIQSTTTIKIPSWWEKEERGWRKEGDKQH